MPDTPQEAEPSPEQPAVVYVDYHEVRASAHYTCERDSGEAVPLARSLKEAA